jgi:methylated-DNA-protein-cysteine methyltransferase-like protein
MHKGNRRKGQGEVDGYQLTVNSQLSTNSREQGTGNRDKGIGNSQKGKGNRNFFEDVFEVVRLIPPGRVTNYGSIAKYLGSGLSSRMVGWAMNASHIAHPPVPAQRVVNRNGMLTGKHHFATPTLMQELLEKEGIKIEKDKVVDFKNIFWDPAVELEL